MDWYAGNEKSYAPSLAGAGRFPYGHSIAIRAGVIRIRCG